MILTYHFIVKRKSQVKDENFISLSDFTKQMDELKNYDIVDFNNYDENNPKHIVITFDDGSDSIMSVLPILKKYKYKFSIFIVGDWIGKKGFLNYDDLRKIVKLGGNLQWHTKTHKNLTTISDNDLISELTIDKNIKKLDPNGFQVLAYPFWAYNERIINFCKKMGFKKCRSGNNFKTNLSEINNNNNKYYLDSIKMKGDTKLSEKIVKYIELVVPTYPCNFRCHYCYVGQHCNDKQRAHVEKFECKPEELKNYLSINNIGGKAIVNFCAHGETLILPQNIPYIKSILEAGHFVMVVSNMTQTKAINELLSLPKEYLERLFFKCSFHYLELKRLNLLEVFTSNVNNAWNQGASITVEITPSDELEPYIEEIKEYSLKNFGALPHITVPRDENNGYNALTKHSKEHYKEIWGCFDSELFNFKMSIWGKKNKDFCYAGVWGYSINMANGNIFRCSSCGYIGNLFKDKKLPVNPAGKKCPFPHCYNGHFWDTFGMIPNHRTPTYTDIRNRIKTDGTSWLHPRMISAFNSKTLDNNKRFSKIKEFILKRPRKKHAHTLWWHIKNMKF